MFQTQSQYATSKDQMQTAQTFWQIVGCVIILASGITQLLFLNKGN